MKGITSIIEIFILLQQFIDTAGKAAQQTPYAAEMKLVKDILMQPQFEQLLKEKVPVKIDYEQAAVYDRLLRFYSTGGSKGKIRKQCTISMYIFPWHPWP